MAKQTVGYLGGFQGTLGPAIGYMWNGKWCVRSRPTSVRNPRTPEQVAQREMFRRKVQLAADLGDAVRISMRDMAREVGITSYNLFVHVNQHAFSLEDGVFEVDYWNLRLSMGEVPQVENARMEPGEHNVLEVSYDKGHGYSHDLVFMMVYAPGLKRSLLSRPAFRKDKKIAVALPDKFVGEELQVWLMVQSPDGRWSESVYVDSEELGVRNEELSDEPKTYSSPLAKLGSPSPNVGEESGMQGERKTAAPPE